ncbi:MAG: hypothetical protein RLZZ210_383 [Pseudomonadota bacterium]|jgi:peptide deformylase
MLLEILHYPDERLRNIAQPVTVFDDKIIQIVQDMFETMYHANGIGLAAIQVGIKLRIVTMDLTGSEKKKPVVFINPTLTNVSQETNVYEEGCLSVPGVNEKVERPKMVTINAYGMDGKPFSIEADELLSTCIQHEIDHLDGKVFIDRISRLKKSRIDEKIKKSSKV